MQTSRFQLALLCTLSLSLGLSIASSDAIGYPAGSVISSGQNPIEAIGGTAYSSEPAKLLLTAPDDQDLVITDVVLTSTSDMDCKRSHKSELSTSDGRIVGQFETTSDVIMTYGSGWGTTSDGRVVSHSYSSGLRINRGESLLLGVVQTGTYTFSSCDAEVSHGVRYSVSGYFAQP